MEKQFYNGIKSSLEKGIKETYLNLDYFTWKIKEGVREIEYSLKDLGEDFKEEFYNVGRNFLKNFGIEKPKYVDYLGLKKRKEYLLSLDRMESSRLNPRVLKIVDIPEEELEDKLVVWAKDKCNQFKESNFYVRNYNNFVINKESFTAWFKGLFGKIFK